MAPEKPVDIEFTPNGKWFHIDGINGWIRVDTIDRVQVNKHGDSIVYLNFWYHDRSGADYHLTRCKDIFNAQAVMMKFMGKVGT